MNEKHRQLYDLMVERDLISKSYDEFTTNFSQPSKQKQLYGFLIDNDVISTNIAEDKFYETIFDVKKKRRPNFFPFNLGQEPHNLSRRQFRTRFLRNLPQIRVRINRNRVEIRLHLP